MTKNKLSAPWQGPMGGVPPLDEVQLDWFEPAFEIAADRARQAARAIRDNPEPPSLENTVEALERLDFGLWHVLSVYHLWSSNLSTPQFREVERRIEPRSTALWAELRQDRGIYARLEAVASSPGLDPVEQRVCEKLLRGFQWAGAHLDGGPRARVKEINERLSVLYTTFSENVLADEEGVVHLFDEDQLGGLPASYRAAARRAAEERGHPGRYAVTNTRSSVEPFLQDSTERELRERVWRAFYGRADNDDEHDNNAIVSEILALRAERAKLLGHDHHAAMVLAPNMAKNADNALGLLRQVWDRALGKLRRELDELQALAEQQGHKSELEPWDVRFYAKRHRQQQDASSDLRDYLQLDRLREGMFWAAGQLYGWTFEPIDVPVAHPDVRVWAVMSADGSDRGLYYLDPYARSGKRSGAWMSAFRIQSKLDGGSLPLVTNNCNYTKPAPGQPALLSLDEARTLFHEFGHAIHGLASEVRYGELAGTNVARDFVEFPSQINEHWLTTREILERFAVHHETGEPAPAEVLDAITETRTADSGFRTMEYLASAVVDMEMHCTTDPIDPRTFEREVLERWGLPKQVVMRHRTPHFGHLFAGEGYSAGYYAYLWADVLTADAAEAFAEQGFYDRQLARRLMDKVLSVGNSVDPATAYWEFRGQEPRVEPLLRERGLAG